MNLKKKKTSVGNQSTDLTQAGSPQPVRPRSPGFPPALTVDVFFRTQALGKYRCVEKETDMLLSTLSAMQENAQHLEYNLSAETRIKLDLFSALGDARRQLEIAHGQHLHFFLVRHTNMEITHTHVHTYMDTYVNARACTEKQRKKKNL